MPKRYAYIIAAIIFLYLIPAIFVESFRNASLRMVGSVGHFFVRQNIGVGSIFHNIYQIPTLKRDKEVLQKQVITLQQQLTETENLKRENEALRNELGIKGFTREAKKVFARVIIQGNDPSDRTLTIDVGSQQGVKVGQPAIFQGTLIGKVITVRDQSAVIRLVTSKESKIQAWVVETRDKGLLQGDGNSVFLSEIDQEAAVREQSVIETSGLGGSLPQGILIGEVGSKQSRKNDLSQKFLVKLPHDPGSLESVFILLINTP